MEFTQFANIIRGNMPYDKGNMFSNGVDFFVTPYYDLGAYNNNRVNYIRYNEEGTKYTKKNKGFISKKTVGMVNKATWSENLGLPFDSTEMNEEVAKRNNDLLLKQGAIEHVTTSGFDVET
jgi:ABC-type lipoprotein export system ATPase subunit